MSVKTTIKRENRELVLDKSVRDLRMSSCPPLFVVLFIILGCFWRIRLCQKSNESNILVGLLCTAARYFILTKTVNCVLFSTTNRVFLPLVGPSDTEKSTPTYNWIENETCPTKFDKIYFLYQQSQPL